MQTSMFMTTSRFEEDRPTNNNTDCFIEENGEEDEEGNMEDEINPWDQSVFDSMNLEPVSATKKAFTKIIHVQQILLFVSKQKN